MLTIKTTLTSTLILAGALALTACQTTANSGPNWVKAAENGEIVMLVDTSSITPSTENADWRNGTVLVQQPEGASSAFNGSMILDTTVNCATQEARINEVRLYEQPHGQGNLLNTQPGSNGFLPSTSAEDISLVEIICK